MNQALNLSVFDTFPELETERLRLRGLKPQDADAIYNMRNSGAVNRFIARNQHPGKADVMALIDRCVENYNGKQGIAWAGEIKGNKGKLIGTCGFNRIDCDNLRAEIGGEMATNYWGRKLALEAVEAIVKFGFQTLKLHSIEAKVMPGNRGAIALLIALGFEQEALFKDRIWFENAFHDMAVYSKLAQDFA